MPSERDTRASRWSTNKMLSIFTQQSSDQLASCLSSLSVATHNLDEMKVSHAALTATNAIISAALDAEKAAHLATLATMQAQITRLQATSRDVSVYGRKQPLRSCRVIDLVSPEVIPETPPTEVEDEEPHTPVFTLYTFSRSDDICEDVSCMNTADWKVTCSACTVVNTFCGEHKECACILCDTDPDEYERPAGPDSFDNHTELEEHEVVTPPPTPEPTPSTYSKFSSSWAMCDSDGKHACTTDPAWKAKCGICRTFSLLCSLHLWSENVPCHGCEAPLALLPNGL